MALEANDLIEQDIQPVMYGIPDDTETEDQEDGNECDLVPEPHDPKEESSSSSSASIQTGDELTDMFELLEENDGNDADDDQAVVEELLRRDKGKAPAGRARESCFSVIGDAIRDDIPAPPPLRSRITPVPRFERRRETGEVGQTISLLATLVAQQSAGSGNAGGQTQEAARITSMQEEVKTIISYIINSDMSNQIDQRLESHGTFVAREAGKFYLSHCWRKL